jgi:hypothetical protein
MKALRLAGSSLYCKPESFTFYAGSNKVIDYARSLHVRIDALNALWARQVGPLAGAGDGNPIQTPAQWDTDAVRLQFMGTQVRMQLARYATAAHERDQLDALSLILDQVLIRLAAVPAIAPIAVPVAAPPPAAHLAQIVPFGGPVAAPVAAPAVAWVDPLDAIRVFGRRVRDRMEAIEAACAAILEATVLQNA